MNAKIKYMIPAFAAVIALAFAFAPSVLADDAAVDQMHARWDEGHHGPKGPMGPHAIAIEGFKGSVAIPQDITKDTRDSLKEQVTVTLSQAANVASSNGFDGMSANLGVVDDGAGNKYLAWTIVSIDKDAETNVVTSNVFVVDAGDAKNFAQMTQTFDRPMKGDGQWPKAQGFHKFADNLDPETKTQFQDLMDQIRQAHQNGDTEAVKNLKNQLQELKQTLHETTDNGV